MHPKLKDYSFPHHILPDDYLNQVLHPDRIQSIRADLSNLNESSHGSIRYFIPWNLKENVEPGSVDYFISQAVLEYVDDLDRTYRKFNMWLAPGGLMSHCIDFSAHGITNTWNAHWAFSAFEWRLVHGNKQIILNRVPRSGHLKQLDQYHFELLYCDDMHRASPYSVSSFHPDYQYLSEEDAKTYASFMLSRKKV